MKLGSICSTPCFPAASDFSIPNPGCGTDEIKDALKFASAEGRSYYSALIRNHELGNGPKINPRITIVGLSPGGNQLDKFSTIYEKSGDYWKAAMSAAFDGLSGDIVRMMNGLGLSQKIGIKLKPEMSFVQHPEILVTSLVACASLTDDGSSNDFVPSKYGAAKRCVADRFLPEILNPDYSRLKHVVILGEKAWAALHDVRTEDNISVANAIIRSGKKLVLIPHPSGGNRESVKLASFTNNEYPPEDEYVAECWQSYLAKPLPKGKIRQAKGKYTEARRSRWNSVLKMRLDINNLKDEAN